VSTAAKAKATPGPLLSRPTQRIYLVPIRVALIIFGFLFHLLRWSTASTTEEDERIEKDKKTEARVADLKMPGFGIGRFVV
jgi:hypothetical protein